MMIFVTYTDGQVGSYRAASYEMSETLLTIWKNDDETDAFFVPFAQIRHVEVKEKP